MTKTWTITKITQVAKAVSRTITQDCETFNFAPVGCDPEQIPQPPPQGFYVLT